MADLLDTATQQGKFKTLLWALEATELTDMLKSSGPFTILAPTDEAFGKLPQRTLDDLEQHPHRLKQVLMYHVLHGDVRSDDLEQIEEAPTVGGLNLVVEHNGGVLIENAHVTEMDILTENGVIHVIDKVLMPSVLGD